MGDTSANNKGMNHARLYQLILFPFNNGATNVYYVLTMSFIAYYANGVLSLSLMFATTMVTVMRVFDAVTDPILGALIDKTNGRFGKFRPFMVIGNLIMIVSSLLLYFGLRLTTHGALRYVFFVLFYMLYVIGYTFQTACTRSGQTCLTNDPKQRPLFTIFNTVASMAGMGIIQLLAPMIASRYPEGYNSARFFNQLIPLCIIVSALLTVLAVIGIWEKDNASYFGVAGNTKQKIKVRDYIEILKSNGELRRLIIAGAGSKLAFAIATNMTVLCMLYGCMMKNYNGLYLPMMILGYVFSAPFFLLTVKVSQKYGQKYSLMLFTFVALVMYVGVLILLLLWKQNVPSLSLNLSHLNLYTFFFILFFCTGYGAYYATADMSIPMVADCSDYETFRSGKYVPGIMGTLFSLVDKLVSSLGSTIVGLSILSIGIKTLPDGNTPYASGMKTIVIILFCIVPMVAWIIALVSMKGYRLNAEKMREIQMINYVRKFYMTKGCSLEEVMVKYSKIEDVPPEFVQQ